MFELTSSPHEVHAYLTNLRTELLEERASLKGMRKGMRKHRKTMWYETGRSVVGMELDDITLKTMNDDLRHLIKRFKALERPFLEPVRRSCMTLENQQPSLVSQRCTLHRCRRQ